MVKGMACTPCPTYRILECIDDGEYTALSLGNKKKIDLIISCGTVDTCPGSIIHNVLEAIFPSGLTRTALDELFSPIPGGG